MEVKFTMSRIVKILLSTFAVALIAITTWAAFTPVTFASRDVVFEIPKGTWQRRMSGDNVDILPPEIFLTLGIHDVLVLRNADDVPQIFGPTLMMPGQSFRLPFEVPSINQFNCTAHASGQMTIVVDPNPDSPMQRIAWRARTIYRFMKAKLTKPSL
jgi:hypothetical protein